MPARNNRRIFYANQLVAITESGDKTIAAGDLLHGVQEVGISTNFSNQPYFELGQLAIYEDVEQLPDVEVTLSKAFDNKPFIWHQATKEANQAGTVVTTPTLIGRSNQRCNVLLGLYQDSSDFVTGTPASMVVCSGMFPSSLQYTFPVQGTFTESVTLVGNNKLWRGDSKIVNAGDISNANSWTWTVPNSAFSGDVPNATYQSTITEVSTSYYLTGIGARHHLTFAEQNSAATLTGNGFAGGLDVNGMCADYDRTILPPDVDGISTSGTNNQSDGANFDAHVQSINISTNLGRENLNELGRRGPYHRYVTFPVEVTCAIEVIATSGDMISATENGILSTSASSCAVGGNLRNRTIRIATCHGEVFYLGTKNRLTSVQYGGGSTDGGNATITYSFRNYNTLTIMAVHDPHARNDTINGGAGSSNATDEWWLYRRAYLVN